MKIPKTTRQAAIELMLSRLIKKNQQDLCKAYRGQAYSFKKKYEPVGQQAQNHKGRTL